MAFKTSSDGTLGSAKQGALASISGIPAMYGTGDHTTLPSNENKIAASDGAANDSFGKSVSVGSGRIVVGASTDDTYKGSAYIFDLDGTQLAKITASDGATFDQFGASVAVGSGRIVVGSPFDDDNGSSSGSAYIFDLNGTQLAKITASDGASNDYFGASVAVGSGRIVVGANGDDDAGSDTGSAYIFNLNGTQLAKITASDAAANNTFGNSVAIGSGRIVVGASKYNGFTGSVYIFDLDGNEIIKITASDGAAGDSFGERVAVGSGRIVVSATGDDNYKGSAYIYDLNGNLITKITASGGASFNFFGYSAAVGNGRIIVGSIVGTGFSYVYDLDGNELVKIAASDGAANDQFGVSVTAGNGRIVIGADYSRPTGSVNRTGTAYIYNTPDVITPYEVQDRERA